MVESIIRGYHPVFLSAPSHWSMSEVVIRPTLGDQHRLLPLPYHLLVSSPCWVETSAAVDRGPTGFGKMESLCWKPACPFTNRHKNTKFAKAFSREIYPL